MEKDKIARLRGLYQPGAERGVDIDFTTNWSPSPLDDVTPYDAQPDEDTREFIKRSIANRRGSKKFRNALLAAYHEECAVTRSDAVGALEAAHIDPFRGGRTDHVQNGLLLRADIHTLFDLHQLTIGHDYRIIVSPELGSSTYRDLAGTKISLPDNKSQHPDQEALGRHRADCVWYSGH
ncbi:HNH endonuclease [Gordonia sp. HY285]|nr:HNH endonuclease [Gordonia liuliyuniae]